jgi:hypothetical protein
VATVRGDGERTALRVLKDLLRRVLVGSVSTFLFNAVVSDVGLDQGPLLIAVWFRCRFNPILYRPPSFWFTPALIVDGSTAKSWTGAPRTSLEDHTKERKSRSFSA